MFIKKTKSTPYIHISEEDCVFEIKGDSYAFRIREFYAPLLSWIENDMCKISCEMKWIIQLNLINSESLVIFSEIFFKMNSHFNTGMNIQINWLYTEDDDDMFDTGEVLSELTKIPFHFVLSNE